MKLSVPLLALAYAAGLAGPALAHDTNPKLQFAMKAISKDATDIAVPTKKPDPANVTGGQVLNAVMRARTAQYLLQNIIDKRGDVVDGKLKEDEMSPGGLEKKTPAEAKQLLDLFAEYLKKAKDKLHEAEVQLMAQYELGLPPAGSPPGTPENPEKRDFRAVKALLTDLESLIAEAHKIFRPARSQAAEGEYHAGLHYDP